MAGQAKAPERRKFPRQGVVVTVLIEPAARQGKPGVQVKGKTRDLSTSGAYIWTAGNFQPGQALRLTLDVESSQERDYNLEIGCKALVVRTEGETQGKKGQGVAVRIVAFEMPQIIPTSSSRSTDSSRDTGS